jgi:hypothetical protein
MLFPTHYFYNVLFAVKKIVLRLIFLYLTLHVNSSYMNCECLVTKLDTLTTNYAKLYIL